jgi:transcriptional regulator with XRE-family HTH domain
MRVRISRIVRQLRTERGWTQVELAKKLGLSQNRLSEIERGDGSFTAEQLLSILQLFNVPVSKFIGESNRIDQLQNALARAGAFHLVESDALPADDLVDVPTAIRETLLAGEPRLTVALAPVLVAHADRIGLHKLYLDLAEVGRELRLVWLCENTLIVLDAPFIQELPRPMGQRARRTAVVLKAFLDPLRQRDPSKRTDRLDVLDLSIRSPKTLADVQIERSEISKRWGIVSALQTRDFADAIRASSAAHP